MRINLRPVRHWRLLTLDELSALTGISKANLSRIETGKQEPRISTVRRLAQALDVDPLDLIEDDKEEPQR